MLYLLLIEFFLVVSVEWSTVSAQNFSFDQTATGPSVTCRGGSATFTCRIVNDGGFLQSNLWLVGNRTVITGDTPNHMLSTNPMGLISDLVVSNVVANATYICTTAAAPSDFFSTAPLTVAEPPIISEITLRGGCGYLNVSWTSGDGMCGTVNYIVSLSSSNVTMTNSTTAKSYNFTGLPLDTIFDVTVFASDMAGNGTPRSDNGSTIVPQGPNAPTMVMASFDISTNVITVMWQAPSPTAGCTANIINYIITVMDQNSSANITVSPDMTSVDISELASNGTSIVVNKQYTITVSASNEARSSGPSGPVIVNTFILQNCVVTSPSVGTVRVSCDSSHQIQVTVTCTSCTQPMTITEDGSSPVVVMGLRPGAMYSVTINVFDGSQVILSGQRVTEVITAMSEGDDGGSNAGAIAGGVIGGVAGLVLLGIILFVVYWFCLRDKDTDAGDEENLKSPTGTGVNHPGGKASVKPASSAEPPVLYDAPDQSAIVPHQKAATGEEYAVSTKAPGKPKKQQKQPTEEYAQIDKSRKKQPQINYADLADLPTSGNKPIPAAPTATYAQVA